VKKPYGADSGRQPSAAVNGQRRQRFIVTPGGFADEQPRRAARAR
jgi:hypothetical protein